MVMLVQQNNREALAEFRQETQKWARLAGIAIAQDRLGSLAEAKAALAELASDTETVCLYQQGKVLAQWGATDEAIATLARARAEHDAGLIDLRFDPMLDPLRRHPEFIDLLKSMGLD
jgi:predicted Zn-dependent protease